jgi:hypothetical protein
MYKCTTQNRAVLPTKSRCGGTINLMNESTKMCPLFDLFITCLKIKFKPKLQSKIVQRNKECFLTHRRSPSLKQARAPGDWEPVSIIDNY